MPNKYSSQSDFRVPRRPRPGQDVTRAKSATQFPTIGMTLGSYTGAQNQTSTGSPLLSNVRTDQNKPRLLSIFFHTFTLKRILISLILIVLVVVGWVGGKFIYNTHKVFGGNIFSILTTTQLQGESSGRVNILLAGNSSDDSGHQGAQLTDSIMLLSIDTKNNTAFMLSIPRDLWVNIPGIGYQKINDAYVAGENGNFNSSGYFSGGMGQLQQIVEKDFNIPIDYYALIDYTALKDAVNAVGGITITIQSPDPRGLYDPSIDYSTHKPLVDLTNGVHQLGGQQALDLARARGDDYGSYGFPNSDFDRTQHQRQMLVALKDKAVTLGVLSNPDTLSSLSDAIGNNVTTNLTLSEVHRLYNILKPIKSNNIQSLSINSADGKNLLTDYYSNGEESLIPAAGLNNYSAIQAFVAQQTSSNPIVKEDASIVILNGTDTSRFANKEKSILTAKGLYVSAIGDANAIQNSNTIIDNTNGAKPATKQLLSQLFGTRSITTNNPYNYTYQADYIVILGSNSANSTTVSSN